jgi:hypothetical protein
LQAVKNNGRISTDRRTKGKNVSIECFQEPTTFLHVGTVPFVWHPLITICSGRPMDMDKPHYLPDETFLRFRKFKFKNKIYQLFNCE